MDGYLGKKLNSNINIQPDIEKIKQLPIHIILCTERTGSSLLNTMLNMCPEALAISEQLFVLYFYPKYHNKVHYTAVEIEELIKEFVYLSEKELKFYFSDLDVFRKNLLANKDNLPFDVLIRLIYWHYFDIKDKSQLKIFVEKQIKYLIYIEDVLKVFPNAKFIILTRNVLDNVMIRKKRNINHSSNLIYLSALWNESYKNVRYVLENVPQDRILFVRYRHLVGDTENTLKKICCFLGISFYPEMLNYHSNYNLYLEHKKKLVGESYYKKMFEKHQSIQKPLNTMQVDIGESEIALYQKEKIYSFTHETCRLLGYDVNSSFNKTRLNLFDKMQIWRAKIKVCILKRYLYLPLMIKIFIKKINLLRTQDI